MPPFTTEHIAQQTAPKGLSSLIREHTVDLPEGIDTIIGVRYTKGRRMTEVHSFRFNGGRWTPSQSVAWLDAHGFKTGLEVDALKEAYH